MHLCQSCAHSIFPRAPFAPENRSRPLAVRCIRPRLSFHRATRGCPQRARRRPFHPSPLSASLLPSHVYAPFRFWFELLVPCCDWPFASFPISRSHPVFARFLFSFLRRVCSLFCSSALRALTTFSFSRRGVLPIASYPLLRAFCAALSTSPLCCPPLCVLVSVEYLATCVDARSQGHRCPAFLPFPLRVTDLFLLSFGAVSRCAVRAC